MLLQLENSIIPMKLVYLLSEELKANPEQITQTQALTLDNSKPYMGLKGSHGLFGSQQWWDNIKQHNIPLMKISGLIIRTYIAGQDPSIKDNTFTLLLDDGTTCEESIYNFIEDENKELFRIGSRVEIIYIRDELKRSGNKGEKEYLDIVLEMAVSLNSVK